MINLMNEYFESVRAQGSGGHQWLPIHRILSLKVWSLYITVEFYAFCVTVFYYQGFKGFQIINENHMQIFLNDPLNSPLEVIANKDYEKYFSMTKDNTYFWILMVSLSDVFYKCFITVL